MHAMCNLSKSMNQNYFDNSTALIYGAHVWVHQRGLPITD